MKGLRGDNRGLSLLELIVAVAILAAVVTPLLHAFITSANTAAKSARLGRATQAAQNVRETLEATHMDDLVTALSTPAAAESLFGAQSVTPPEDLSPGLGSYSFRLNGIEAGGMFDALVTLNAEEAFAEQNSVLVTQYTPMDAVFSQPGEDDANPDKLAAAEFAAYALIDGESIDFTDQMSREITIDIVEANDKVNVGITFAYSAEYTYDVITVNDEDEEIRTPTQRSVSYSRSYSILGESGAIFGSVYFFFYPNYLADPEGTDDVITVNNTGDKACSVFLVKQGTGQDPATYNAKIALVESGNAEPAARVLSNIAADRLTGDSIALSGDIVTTEAEYRMYEADIEIFEPGKDETLYTLTASKLD